MKKALFFALVATLLLSNQVSFAETNDGPPRGSKILSLEASIETRGGDKMRIGDGISVIPGTTVTYVARYSNPLVKEAPGFTFSCFEGGEIVSGKFHFSSEGDLVTDEMVCKYETGGVPSAKISLLEDGKEVSASSALSVAYPSADGDQGGDSTNRPISTAAFAYAIGLVVLAGVVHLVVHSVHKVNKPN